MAAILTRLREKQKEYQREIFTLPRVLALEQMGSVGELNPDDVLDSL